MKEKIREEKTCLNCGYEVLDKYCPHCGQENRDPKETLGELIHHFFSDITHYDSKFFKTIKDLIFRPGFLTREYLAGRRMRYLNPVRMYVFISFLFFLVYFTFFSSPVKVKDSSIMGNVQVEDPLSRVNRERDSASGTAIMGNHGAVDHLHFNKTDQSNSGISITGRSVSDYKTIAEFDSAQLALPAARRLKGVVRFLVLKWVGMRQEYGNRRINVLTEDFRHNIPKIMFLLLPIFALLLSLFYIRRTYNYVSHAIFTIHFHSFVFLILLAGMILDGILRISIFSLLGWIWIFIYLVIAQKNTYHQSIVKSFFKACLIGIFYGIALAICLGATAILTLIAV